MAAEVLLALKEAKNGLDACERAAKATEILSSLFRTLSDSAEMSAAFRGDFYVDFCDYLLQIVASKPFPDKNQLNIDTFFLKGPPKDALFLLTESLDTKHDRNRTETALNILERWLDEEKLRNLLWNECQTAAKSQKQGIRLLSGPTERLVKRIVSLPDLVANRLRVQNRPVFLPKAYFRLLAKSIMNVLVMIADRLRGGSDCSLGFLTSLVGKASIHGHADVIVSYLLSRFDSLTLKDPLWRRLAQRLFTDVPPQTLESLIGCLLGKIEPETLLLDRLLGDAVCSNEKLRFLFTQKFTLMRSFSKDTVLLNVSNYLSSSERRRKILLEALESTLKVWSDSCALKNTPYDHHLYITKVVLAFACHLRETESQKYKDALLRVLMHGVQSHLASPIDRLRRLGMVVGECVGRKLDSSGVELKFEYDVDDEVKLLWSLSKLPDDLNSLSERRETEEDSSESEPLIGKGVVVEKVDDNDSDDEDDDLKPYPLPDESKVQKKTPVYLLDLIAGLLARDDNDRVQASLEGAESLIRAGHSNLSDVAAELMKILLHLQDSFYFPQFGMLRHKAMVAAAVMCPHQAVPYLTSEFFNPHYSLTHRIDMLEVISSAARELSDPTSVKKPEEKVSLVALDQDGDIKSWQAIVQKRIESKTKRYHRPMPKPAPVANRFSQVAGLFFYPLMKNYDTPLNTMNLLDQDSFVLGRLVYTLGIVLHSAAHSPSASLMASTLLDFIWTLRFHSERYVQYSLVFALCMVLTSVSPAVLVCNLQSILLESHSWLKTVLQSDDDARIQELSMQAIALLESVLREGINT